jgi:cytochrome c-type biogenesis protein CcmH/NrfF
MIHADLTAPLTQTELRVDNVAIWTSPVIALALGLGVAAHFP